MKQEPVRSTKILIGKEAIRQYLTKPDGSPVAWETVQRYMRWGMPAIYRGRVWYAHADHIDEFFKQITFHRPDGTEQGDAEDEL